MTHSSENKYANLEKQIDEILSDGKLVLFPPGTGAFLLVNLLVLVGISGLIISAQEILFDKTESAMIFFMASGLVLCVIAVTPPFFMIRGFRKALPYAKKMIVFLSILTLVFGLLNLVNGGKSSLFAVISFIALVLAYMLANSNAYLLLSIFTARRRELALEALEKRRRVLSK